MIRSRPARYVLAAVLPVVVATVLTTLRDRVDAANLALILALAVVSAAVLGGRGPGVVASVIGAAAFDFFLTVPYQSFTIDKSGDLLTAALLLLLGLVVGELSSWAGRQRHTAGQRAEDVGRMFYVSELLAGEEAAQVPATVAGELSDLLSLQECYYDELPPDPELACLEPDGRLIWGEVQWPVAESGFPVAGAELPVRYQGKLVGTFHLRPGAPTPVDGPQLLVAVALADLAGAVLARQWEDGGGT